MSFNEIKQQVAARFQELAKHKLYTVELPKDELFQMYLAYLVPELRQEHRCNCCRQFLNNYGNVVAIVGGRIKTLWDFEIEGVYKYIPHYLGDLVRNTAIKGPFVSKFAQLGTDSNTQPIKDAIGKVVDTITWTHFAFKLPATLVNRSSDSIEAIQGTARTNHQVFVRALTELKMEAVDTILDLINRNTLYRGAEFKDRLVQLKWHLTQTSNLNTAALDLYCWENSNWPYTGIRNSSIGTLLVDLSEGRDLEAAVKAYENVVAPANYKRPTALVTPKMLENAQAKLIELGLERAIYRRFAVPTDISVANTFFVDRSAQFVDVFHELKQDLTVNPKQFKALPEVSYHDFVAHVLPTAVSVELLLENRHTNYMSLLTAVDEDAPLLFSWGNPISWTYGGDMTDSVKERVKAAGGKVEGELRISLEWFNTDDLDLHVIEPDGHEIQYSDKRSRRGNGGLDVDMNVCGDRRDAVENVIFNTKDRMTDGQYTVIVHNFNKRENIDLGFNIEIENNGEILTFADSKAVPHKAQVRVCTFRYTKDKGVHGVVSNVTSDSKAPPSKQVWNLNTNKFHKATHILNSPNHWGGNEKGNLHHFFILNNCKNPDQPRGFFNEYLRHELQEHRKVFEVLGSKLKVPASDQQLSGLGFSSTQQADVVARVKGDKEQIVRIIF
jgi:hypothetical protein